VAAGMIFCQEKNTEMCNEKTRCTIFYLGRASAVAPGLA